MKKNFKKIIVLLTVLLLLTGCTKTLTDDNKQRVINDNTGQALTANILCLPESEDLSNIYSQNKDKLGVDYDKLNTCADMKVWEKDQYDGLWVQIFVRPLAWLIINVGKFVGNYGLSVMIIGLLIRVILLPFTIKSTKQSEIMKEMQPELQKLEKKYAGKDDQQSMMKKSQETMMIYQKYKVNPMSSCLIMLIQLPIFFAFLEAINRTPAIFENTFWKFQLGTTPLFGIQHNNYWYIILLVLIILFTALTFLSSMSTMSGSTEQQKQSKMMMYMMIVFIGIASFQLPSAIALYWVITNAFSVVQTFIIKKLSNKGGK